MTILVILIAARSATAGGVERYWQIGGIDFDDPLSWVDGDTLGVPTLMSELVKSTSIRIGSGESMIFSNIAAAYCIAICRCSPIVVPVFPPTGVAGVVS